MMKIINLTNDQKNRIKIIQLEMLREVDRICNKNNIKYCLGFGSMLGAVRHKGFIPWDDDADILMLREDYEKFKIISKEEFGNNLFFQDNETDEEYLWGYAKIRNINTEYIRVGQEHINSKTGVFIDIFPLDNVPDDLIGKIWQDFICSIYRKILWSQVAKKSETNIVRRVVYFLLSKTTKRTVYKKINELIKRYNKVKTKRVRCLLFTAPGKHWNKKNNSLSERYGFKREWLEDRKLYEFDGAILWGTKNYDECLKFLYGDYMKLPPENKRVGHAPVSRIELNNEGLLDNAYWNQYYSNKNNEEPSLFAQFVNKKIERRKKIIDIGCGNGRDSIFFSNNNMDVVSIDLSEEATSRLQNDYGHQLTVINDNFVNYLANYQQEYDYIYSRFTIHAITEEEQNILLKNAYEALKDEGKIFIEVRCKKDDIYGKGEYVKKDTFFYNGHKRRFVDKDEIESIMMKIGYIIEYSEENKGFAPWNGTDPIMLRIIAKRDKVKM